MNGQRFPVVTGELAVLGEYRGLLFIEKPAGLQTEPDARHEDTLVTRISGQLSLPRQEIHALSRLDTAVSGIVTLGISKEGRRLVAEWRAKGQFRRRYLALASGHPGERRGAWSESIGHAAGNLRRVGGRDPEASHTEFLLSASSPPCERASPRQVHLLALAPLTGRTHQLRVHSAAHALPLLGDRAYGGVTRLISDDGRVRSLARVALHAAWVELPLSPPIRFQSAFPAELLSVWSEFGGASGAVVAALAAAVGD